MAFHGYNRGSAKVSEGVRQSLWLQGMMAGMPAAYFCIKVFSEADMTEDLEKIDVPIPVLHLDDDQAVPIADSARLSVKPVENSKPIVYGGAPRGMCATLKDRVDADLQEFISG